MIATSGARLIEDVTIAGLVERLFPLATLVTPNLDEAETLLGRSIRETGELKAATRDLIALGCNAVLLKGGHLNGPELVDVLALRGPDGAVSVREFCSPRIDSPNLHGTGCTLSSAIACRLALGDDLPAAVGHARAYIREAIAAGAAVTTGHGHGPLNHGFAPVAMHTLKNR